MPNRIRQHRPTPGTPTKQLTLKDKQRANGRTLALDGAAWRKLRAVVLAEQPLCPDCHAAGVLRLALDVDHADGDPTNNDRSNLIGRCRPCHSRKTRIEAQARNRQQPNSANRPVPFTHAAAVRSA